MGNRNDYLRAAYAIAVADGYPPILRDELLSKSELTNRAAIETDSVIVLGSNDVSFKRSALFPAVIAAFDRTSSTVITAVDGNDWTVKFAEDAKPPNVVLERGLQRLLVAQFTLLDPDRDARLRAFEAMAKHNLMSRRCVERWRALLAERVPDHRELMEVRQDIQNTPIGEAETIAYSLRDGGLSLDVLIPRETAYYEQLVGDVANVGSLDAYLTDCLTPFLEGLLASGDIKALNLAWLVCGQPLVSPLIDRAWKGGPEALAGAFTWLRHHGDPISDVGAIEVGLLSVQANPQIAEPLRNLITALLNEAPDGVSEPFALISALFVCVYGQMAKRRVLVGWPPFARRAAALAHAALVARQLRDATGNNDAAKLIQWLRGLAEPYFTLQCVIDMRTEPRWFPELASPDQWRYELLGRVFNAAAAAPEIVEALGLTERLLGEGPDALRNHIGGIRSMLPGPLEGALPFHPLLSTDQLAHIDSALRSEQVDTATFSSMINASVWSQLPAAVVGAAIAALKRCEYQIAVCQEVDLAACLLGLASVAAVSRSPELSEALRIVVRLAWRLHPGALTPDATFRIGALSCAAYVDEAEWVKQIGLVMTELALQDLTAGQARGLQANLAFMCHLVPELWGTCGQADAALALAAGW